MAVGAFASYNFMLRIEGMPILVAFILGGVARRWSASCSAAEPAHPRFYLAASTLATQFFMVWCLSKVPWFQQQLVGRDHRAADRDSRFQVRFAGGKVPAGAGHRGGHGARWRRTWCAPRSGARGWRCATWTSPPRSSASASCAPSSRRSRSVSFYCGVAGALFAFMLPRHRGAGGLQPRCHSGSCSW